MKETNWLEGFSLDTTKKEPRLGALSVRFNHTDENDMKIYAVIAQMAKDGDITSHQVAKQMLIHMVESMMQVDKNKEDIEKEDKKIEARKEKQRKYAKDYYWKKQTEKKNKVKLKQKKEDLEKSYKEMDVHNSKVAGDMVRESPNYNS
tara:strand:- start:373 stop:816 length:444 start_codon:yes stop_codon:yes gene_type:complete